ncbi:LysM peptidoglycan-binding domain-containing protein (plasmid) [Arthrobacter agilis]|uniref:LysM peptidoglycan-binding domain-containing protein n=1 Tax=Arthrobacter agilis TaxID=37921 RepID=UPI002366D595|nr:LysM peptidoglycan-binding domain-containing protein [Arthrobacter agilis]WDF35209.1 LysM peptidoglycan-binding domain-containing protein [Arthrobacter agilis]
MTRTSISARHRAAVTHSVALEGLSHSAKTGAVALGKPAIIAAATGGLVFAIGAPAQAGTYTQEANTGTVAQAPEVAAPAAAAGVHTVVAGDTLGAIAAKHGLNLDTLLAQNGLSYASVIYPGQQVKLTGGASVAVSPVAVPAAAPASQVFYAAPAPAAAAVAPAAAPVAAVPGIQLTSASIAPAAPAAPAVPASGVGAALVASAYGQLGSIQDCTVLVERALRSIGKNVGDLGPTQFYQYGSVVSTPAPGDLVIRPGHIAIYVGNGEVISSGMNGANLTIKHPLSDLAGSSFVRVNG